MGYCKVLLCNYHQALFLNPPRVSPQHSSHQSPQALACGVTSAVYTGPLSGAVIRAARDLTTSLVACMFPFLTIFFKAVIKNTSWFIKFSFKGVDHLKKSFSKFYLNNMFYWSQLRSSWSPQVSSGFLLRDMGLFVLQCKHPQGDSSNPGNLTSHFRPIVANYGQLWPFMKSNDLDSNYSEVRGHLWSFRTQCWVSNMDF